MPYINSVVFYHYLTPERWNLISLPPRAMATAMCKGTVDVGPIPTVAAISMGEATAGVGDLCIAVKGKAISVLIFSTKEVNELSGHRIGITSHTASSFALFRVLLKHWWKVTGIDFVSLDSPADAILLIGDAALQARKNAAGWRYVYDLGEEWYKMSGLPFVFALWRARREVYNSEQMCEFKTDLTTSLSRSITNINTVASTYSNKYMSDSEVRGYLSVFIYRLAEHNCRQSVSEFKHLLAQFEQEEH